MIPPPLGQGALHAMEVIKTHFTVSEIISYKPLIITLCVSVADPPSMYMDSAVGLKVTLAVNWPPSEVMMGL